jgi:hypothetical protein
VWSLWSNAITHPGGLPLNDRLEGSLARGDRTIPEAIGNGSRDPEHGWLHEEEHNRSIAFITSWTQKKKSVLKGLKLAQGASHSWPVLQRTYSCPWRAYSQAAAFKISASWLSYTQMPSLPARYPFNSWVRWGEAIEAKRLTHWDSDLGPPDRSSWDPRPYTTAAPLPRHVSQYKNECSGCFFTNIAGYSRAIDFQPDSDSAVKATGWGEAKRPIPIVSCRHWNSNLEPPHR